MATGAGKSLLFMLPACCGEGGTSVVVVPLIALRQDMRQRCERLGVPCVEWNGRRPPNAAKIVLVIPEAALSDGFRSFLTRLHITRALDRIVIDECHVMLNDQPEFRRQVRQLRQLVSLEVQMVLLTATLPPTKERKL